jgi:hypothetical protein
VPVGVILERDDVQTFDFGQLDEFEEVVEPVGLRRGKNPELQLVSIIWHVQTLPRTPPQRVRPLGTLCGQRRCRMSTVVGKRELLRHQRRRKSTAVGKREPLSTAPKVDCGGETCGAATLTAPEVDRGWETRTPLTLTAPEVDRGGETRVAAAGTAPTVADKMSMFSVHGNLTS